MKARRSEKSIFWGDSCFSTRASKRCQTQHTVTGSTIDKILINGIHKIQWPLAHRQVKDHGWILVSKSLTRTSPPLRAGEVS